MRTNSKTFSSRFTMVTGRNTGILGVVEELSPDTNGLRSFNVIWEDSPSVSRVQRTYTPQELIAAAKPYNGKADRLYLDLINNPWWVEASQEESQELAGDPLAIAV